MRYAVVYLLRDKHKTISGTVVVEATTALDAAVQARAIRDPANVDIQIGTGSKMQSAEIPLSMMDCWLDGRSWS